MRKRHEHRSHARILVAGSEHVNALTLSAILERSGYTVATAFAGEEAVMTAASFVPDLFLTEVCLGAVTGIDAAMQITAMFPDCRVLFLSGEASASDVSQSAPPDLVYSITRIPVHPLDLLNAISNLLVAAGNSVNHSMVRATDRGLIEPSTLLRMLASAGFLTNKPKSETGTARRISPGATFLMALLQFDVLPETQRS
jgi:CheY-like chemotaxis protein